MSRSHCGSLERLVRALAPIRAAVRYLARSQGMTAIDVIYRVALPFVAADALTMV
jgi:hypothetical protein